MLSRSSDLWESNWTIQSCVSSAENYNPWEAKKAKKKKNHVKEFNCRGKRRVCWTLLFYYLILAWRSEIKQTASGDTSYSRFNNGPQKECLCANVHNLVFVCWAAITDYHRLKGKKWTFIFSRSSLMKVPADPVTGENLLAGPSSCCVFTRKSKRQRRSEFFRHLFF